MFPCKKVRLGTGKSMDYYSTLISQSEVSILDVREIKGFTTFYLSTNRIGNTNIMFIHTKSRLENTEKNNAFDCVFFSLGK